MLTDKGNIVLPKSPTSDAEDYELLRKTGLDYIQQFSNKVWTDFNVHDPGITIMELLCYSLTDLAYRSSFPVADILTADKASGPDPDDFYTAKKILTSHPVTINDYRKLILDSIPGVRNVWLETLDDTVYTPVIYYDQKTYTTTLVKPPVSHPFETLKLKGLYIVKLEVEDFITLKGHHPHFLKTLAKYRSKDSLLNGIEAVEAEYKECITNYAKHILADHRNLCEDFEIVKIAEEEWVAVCADIELKAEANPDEVFKQINSLLYNYVNPSLQFYSFKELIQKGKRTEDIFNGPAVSRGFIDDDELAKHGHKEVLYVSDIINLLMDIPGIQQIKSIHLSSYHKNNDDTYTIIEDAQQYCLHLNDTANAVFKFVWDAAEQDKKKILNHIRFSKGPIYFSPERKTDYADAGFVDYPALPEDFEDDLPIPGGRYRHLDNYYSLQNDFPLCYYTGMDGIPRSESNLRKAQRLQTKAFLLFFDQLLADYLAGLNNLKNVFTWRGGVMSPTLVPFQLSQQQIKDLRKILASPLNEESTTKDLLFFKDTYNSYRELLETPAQEKERRNRMMDHLLARFNELFVDYTVFKFQQSKTGDFFKADGETIDDKIEFLKSYPLISGKRSRAFDYLKKASAAYNLSGLQLRFQKMMGLPGVHNKSLVTITNGVDYKVLLQNMSTKLLPDPGDQVELKDNRFDKFDKSFGIHVLEHILLRPLYNQPVTDLNKLLPLCGDGTNNQHADCLKPDNYSMQMTVVAPGWLAISNNMDFRSFVENLIRTEAPAHVALKICWLDPALMFLFEKTTDELYRQMAKMKFPGYKPKPPQIKAYNQALTDVDTMMGLLKNMYLPSMLDECENVNYDQQTGEMKVPLILNHSALGSDGKEEWYVFKK